MRERQVQHAVTMAIGAVRGVHRELLAVRGRWRGRGRGWLGRTVLVFAVQAIEDTHTQATAARDAAGADIQAVGSSAIAFAAVMLLVVNVAYIRIVQLTLSNFLELYG